ncbi:MAG: hypothetical protein K0M78_09965 [Brevundimonas sp.]|nr:hypothetical protein [Brevundimonas sp.]
MLALAAAFLTLAGQQSAPPAVDPTGATVLDEVVVIGGYPTGLLTVVVEGEADARALVASEPDLRCGPEIWRWEAYGRPRLCWLRRRLGATVTLSASWTGRPGADWTVDWQGCDRVIAPDRCEVDLRPGNRVRATFHRNG